MKMLICDNTLLDFTVISPQGSEKTWTKFVHFAQ